MVVTGVHCVCKNSSIRVLLIFNSTDELQDRTNRTKDFLTVAIREFFDRLSLNHVASRT